MLEKVDARSDCRLLVAHLSGERVPINPKLVALGNEILELTTRIGSVTVGWTPSDANGVAHALVTEALAPRADSIQLHEEATAPAPRPARRTSSMPRVSGDNCRLAPVISHDPVATR